ncbi:PRC-barrel domain-containing protein [Polaromonas sp. DSR2-3-2]|uniref:PRC-barrel domain-containing protein n=1 Tax=unclassified Polaromonas TaxID=2638319 RepID=UPI003CF80AA1
MKKNLSSLALATLTVVGALCSTGPAAAQVAGGSTTVGVSVTTQLAMGWSVKKALLGKTIYNDAGQKVGRVEDLIISPDTNVSYVIVGAGGFVGIGRHDVAIPVTQIQDKAGKLVMPGATKDTIKDMPVFTYATDTAKRDAFVAAVNEDIAKGNVTIASLEKKAGVAAADEKAKIDADITALQSDVTSAEARLSEMKKAGAVRWREFEADVSAATDRLRKSIQKATG